MAGSQVKAGDGTLPVIHSVQVEFLERGHELQELLPECLGIKLNKSVKSAIEKSFKLKKANLEQRLEVRNINGDLEVSLSGQTISERVRLQMRRQDLNQNEFLNEFNHMDNHLIQHIQINPQSLNPKCKSL